MRPPALLAALLLLALQAGAGALPEKVEEDPPQEQPGDAMAVSFVGTENLLLQGTGVKSMRTCRCDPCCCKRGEHVAGYCTQSGRTYVLCCR